MIEGQPITVTVEAQRALATWFAKLAMVADAMDPKTTVIEQIDREWMRSQSLPPINWQIWIAHYGGTDWRDLAMQHHSGILHLASVIDRQGLSGYVNPATFGLGKLLVLVIGTAIVGWDVNIGKR